MRRLYILALVAALSLFAAPRLAAQDFGGTVLNNDIVTWSDLQNLSFTSHNYGTARSMGMGNAFTALGADMASAMLNPAGIGMYVDSDLSLSPMMQFSKSKTEGGEPFYTNEFKDHSERFGMSSIGAVFTTYRGTGALTNLNIGVAYNRVADFNYNTMSASIGNSAVNSSMANLFCTLSNIDGLQTNSDGSMSFGNDPYYWGATLAYKNGLTNKDAEGWFIDRIAPYAEIDQYSATEVRGSLGEYDFTMGMNFADIVYVGATIGIQSLNYKRSVYYGENYFYPNGEYPSGDDMPYQLEYMNYEQRTRISGTGINFKLGVTVRPVNWWRVGIAYHTPTFMNATLRYGADMWSATYSAANNPDGYNLDKNGYTYFNVGTPVWEDAGENSWNYTSPSRLLLGTAFTLGGRVILSADYERSWYQSVKLKDSPIYGLDYTNITKMVFQGSNTVRVGAEAYLLPFLAVRAGYIYSGNTLRKGYENIIAGHTIPTRQEYITAGLGLKFSRTVYLDLAYQYGTTKYTAHQTFYYTDYDNFDNNIESIVFNDKVSRHIAVVTLGFRF